jgi:hypothetical protein
MTNEQFQTPVFCPTAHALVDDFVEAVGAHFAATKDLISLAGQHEAIAEFKKSVDKSHAKCRSALRALEQHREEHGCRGRDSELQVDGAGS